MSVKSVGFKISKDGGLIIHPALDEDLRSANISVGASGFGQPVSDADLAFAACREPVAHFLTYGVAADVTDKWFYIDDLDTKKPDPELDTNIQTIVTELSVKEHLTEALTQARIYRKCLIVGAFNDAKTINALKTPRSESAQLLQLETYPKTEHSQKLFDYTVERKDEDPNSLRYGKPVIYRIDRGGGHILFVHHSRCIELDNKFSVLTAVWDDLVCGRNIRWGAAQWLFRMGGGFPVIGFPRGTSSAQLEAYCASGAFNDLMNRSYIALAQNSKDENDGMTLDFRGTAGVTLDPVPFFNANLEQISIATGIPQPKLRGAQAGAVTGSEVNLQDYFKVISRIQTGEPTRVIRQIITWLAQSGQITRLQVTSDNPVGDYRRKVVCHYEVVWNSAFELSELDKAKIALDYARANQLKLDYMTIDEVRAEDDLPALPDAEGEKLKGSGLSELFEVPNNSKGEAVSSEAALQVADKFLLIDLKPKPRGKHRHAVV